MSSLAQDDAVAAANAGAAAATAVVVVFVNSVAIFMLCTRIMR